MTHRERWLSVFNRTPPDRIPMDWWGTDETRDKMLAHLGVSTEDELFAALHIDRPLIVAPGYVGPPLDADEDAYGVRYADMDYGTGTYREVKIPSLASFESVDEIDDKFRWPRPDWWDCSGAAEQVKGKEERPVQFEMANMYAIYTRMRGIEQSFIDFAVNHDIVLYCMEKMIKLHAEVASRMFEAIPGRIDVALLMNDMGSQKDLLFSPETARKLFIPGLRTLAAQAREAGAAVMLHSDGAIRKAIPDLIDAGIQVLNPVQWRCEGMDRAALKKDFGEKLMFHGGVDNQQTMVRGTPGKQKGKAVRVKMILPLEFRA